jgi:hypothetical protein
MVYILIIISIGNTTNRKATMTHVPIVRKQDSPADAVELQRLPTFYMADYSVLGFRVSDCERALRILDRHAFIVRRGQGSAEVKIETVARMPAVMQLLRDNGVECEVADIAESMYQG